jgi:hypothetical protein
VNTEQKKKNANKPSFKRKKNKKKKKNIIKKTTKTETKKDDNKNEKKPVIKEKDKKNEIKKNQVNEQKKQTTKEKKEIQKKNTIEKSKPNIEKKLTNDDTIKESEFILIIDGASEMKDHFKNLINNILINKNPKFFKIEKFFFAINSNFNISYNNNIQRKNLDSNNENYCKYLNINSKKSKYYEILKRKCKSVSLNTNKKINPSIFYVKKFKYENDLYNI